MHSSQVEAGYRLGRLIAIAFFPVILMGLSPGCSAASSPESIAARVYPVKAIRFIVASPPGGSGDAMSRLLAARLAEAWAQPVVVDNRPGANGIIGIEMTARAAPDGYTVVMVAASFAINPSLYSRVPYDPIRDFAPVTQVVSAPHVLVVHPTLAVAGVAELVAAARAKPGTIVFGSAGKGTSGHLALELFQIVSQSRFVHVPHRGAAAVLNELVGAQVQALFGIAFSTLPYVRAGRLQALAVTGATRSRAAPQLPTVAESGFVGFEAVGWYGVLAPAKTSPAIVMKLNGAIVQALQSPDVEQSLVAQAADPVGSKPRAFGIFIASETRKWSQLIKQAGVKPN
jgi:tripartite-type tricarboxylate transporter receptor subunit TctC